MSVIRTLISMGLTLRVEADKLIMVGLQDLQEGQAHYAYRLAKNHKDEIVRQLRKSSAALDELLDLMRQAPGVKLFFHAVSPVPAFSLQIDEEIQSDASQVMKANTLFLQASDAIHFNAERLARETRPSMFKWPAASAEGEVTPEMERCYETAAQWLSPLQADLINAGWDEQQLFGTSKMKYPYGWGVAWSRLWDSPCSVPSVSRDGFIEWEIDTSNGVVIQTMRPL